MTAPTGYFPDGTQAFGSQVLTIPTTDGVTYIAEEITPEWDGQWYVNKDQNGIPNNELGILMPFTGTATLQLATATTAPPTFGMPFTFVPCGGGTALAAKVSKVGTPFKQDGMTKVNISFRKQLN